MDLQHLIFIVGGLVASALPAGLMWMGCRWWYGRKLLAAAHRLHKSDQGRLFANQQTMQARRQVEALKKELAAVPKAAPQPEAPRPRAREAESALLLAQLAERDDSLPMPLGTSTPGFADTQLMP